MPTERFEFPGHDGAMLAAITLAVVGGAVLSRLVIDLGAAVHVAADAVGR